MVFGMEGEVLSPSLVPRRLVPVQVLAARFSSWPPRAASSCWAGPQCLIRSWSRSLRRTPTQCRLWGWCTGCCQTTSIQPGAGRSPSLSPEHGLMGQRQADYKWRRVAPLNRKIWLCLPDKSAAPLQCN